MDCFTKHYDYTPRSITYQLQSDAKKKKFEIFNLTFSSIIQTSYIENNTVHCRFYRPYHQAAFTDRVVIFIHGWKERKATWERLCCAILARKGITAMFVTLPYHMQRTPKGSISGNLMFNRDRVQTMSAFHQAVVDVRTVMDWYDQHLENPRGTTSFCINGVSLGSLITSIVTAVDDRVRQATLIISGGNINRIISEGLVTTAIRRQMQRDGISQEEYERILTDFEIFLERVRSAKSGKIIEPPEDRRWFLTDPLTFAHLNRGKQLLMINAKYDLAIPRKSTMDLWKALGEPDIVWLNCTHVTIGFYTTRIIREILATLRGE